MNEVVPNVRSSHSKDPPGHSEYPGRGGDMVEHRGNSCGTLKSETEELLSDRRSV